MNASSAPTDLASPSTLQRRSAARRIGLIAVCEITLFLLGLAQPARAQTATGTVSGTVYDPARAAVPGVRITATNTATGEPRSTVSNSTGYFSLPLLPPATYLVSAELQGFKTSVREGVKVDVALNVAIDITLELGQGSDTITVSSGPAALDTSNSSLAHIVERQRIVDLPLNGRNVYGFVALVPGVRAARGFSAVPVELRTRQFVSINGSRPNQNAFLADGGQRGRETRAESSPRFGGARHRRTLRAGKQPGQTAHGRERVENSLRSAATDPAS